MFKIAEKLGFFKKHSGSPNVIRISLEKNEFFDDSLKLLISYCPNKITFSLSFNAPLAKLDSISGKLFHTFVCILEILLILTINCSRTDWYWIIYCCWERCKWNYVMLKRQLIKYKTMHETHFTLENFENFDIFYQVFLQ